MIKKFLNVNCTKEEAESIELVFIKLKCADQALTLSKEMPKETIAEYISAIIENKSNFQFLNDNWWREMTNKYKLREIAPDPANIFVDFNDGSFYILVEG